MNKLIICFLLGFCSLFLLIQCTPQSNRPETPVTVAQQSTLTVEYKSTSTSTSLPTETEMVLPSSTAIPTLPVPTLSSQQAQTLIINNIENNGNCRFPCVWGFYPGENLDQVQEFIKQYPDIKEGEYDINQYFDEAGGILRFSLESEDGLISYSFEYESEQNTVKWLYFDAIFLTKTNEGYFEDFGHPSLDHLIDYYTLPQILIYYGQPQEIYFRAWELDIMSQETRETYLISLYYPEQGFLIQYNGYSSENTGSHFVICPRNMSVDVTTWDPDLFPTLEEVTEHGISIQLDASYIQYYKTIEEASSMTAEDFYEKFKNPDFTECFETQAEYWRR